MNLAEKETELLSILRDMRNVAVAFSGGVDSAIVAKAAYLALGENAVAVTAASDSLAEGELEQAGNIAQQIGVRHVVVATREFTDPGYIQNAGDRCFYCKSKLYTEINQMRQELGFEVICNGANADDVGDHRPGMIAAKDFAVRSPLIEAGFTKQDVRELAKAWNLPVWDKPATPCLSSRIAYGVEVTPERVRRIDLAEQFLRSRFGIRELRVRLEANDLARIELPRVVLESVLKGDVMRDVVSKLKSLGFRYVTVDLEGFRSGSMNDALPRIQLQQLPSK
ncbi:MAG: ATP-dependent sacrificial sulfur transferase LarE [Planctomycetaceae bacterium]